MRQRGNSYLEHEAKTVPHVLRYQFELVIDGRTLERPVNYGLVRIVPPEGVTIDPKLRPFVIVDPRAGHGPGIGGFKADSEIGVALKAGHPCYFVGFSPNPMPGQTIEDIARAEAVFLEKVIALHPDAEGKPCVIGNCQAGWAVMMVASISPQLFGPIIIVGSPLSYWAGQRGLNPMRYNGGLFGGSWLAALTSDIGNGIFDGAWLVQNFEYLNPANTFWKKPYNLLSKVDTGAPGYLEFERWWGGHVNLTAKEMQSIVDELFVGNKLAAGMVKSSDGTAIDLRNVRSPIVVRATISRPRSRRWAGYSTFTTMSTRSAPTVRRSFTASTKASAISASSSRARWRARSTASSRATSISSTCCRPACTKRCSRQNQQTPPIPNSFPGNG